MSDMKPRQAHRRMLAGRHLVHLFSIWADVRRTRVGLKFECSFFCTTLKMVAKCIPTEQLCTNLHMPSQWTGHLRINMYTTTQPGPSGSWAGPHYRHFSPRWHHRLTEVVYELLASADIEEEWAKRAWELQRRLCYSLRLSVRLNSTTSLSSPVVFEMRTQFPKNIKNESYFMSACGNQISFFFFLFLKRNHFQVQGWVEPTPYETG